MRYTRLWYSAGEAGRQMKNLLGELSVSPTWRVKFTNFHKHTVGAPVALHLPNMY